MKCSLGDTKIESVPNLKIHERIHHMQTLATLTIEVTDIIIDKNIQVKRSDFCLDKEVETDDKKHKFEDYTCHYCSYRICSETQLQVHIEHCSGSNTPSFLNNLPCPVKNKQTFTETKLKAPTASLPGFPSTSLPFGFPPASLPFGLPPPTYNGIFDSIHPSLRLVPMCEKCGWRAKCGTELAKHMKSLHDENWDPFEA